MRGYLNTKISMIYIVIGKTHGKEWIYGAYLDHRYAQQVAAKFNKELQRIGFYGTGGNKEFGEKVAAQLKFREIDPDAYVWGATEYVVESVEVGKDVPFTLEELYSVKIY